jgi:hypothetical protein
MLLLHYKNKIKFISLIVSLIVSLLRLKVFCFEFGIVQVYLSLLGDGHIIFNGGGGCGFNHVRVQSGHFLRLVLVKRQQYLQLFLG